MMRRTTVMVTGATGSMGGATLRELYTRRDRFTMVVLAEHTPQARRALRRYRSSSSVRIVWGDLRDYDTVLECVTGADIVLHIAALISPAADRNPRLTRQVNVGSIQNILRAIAAQPHPDAVRLVNIGSVAMTGSRLPPLHWGRVGDPIGPSIDDHYAVSKIEAERLVIESGLAQWVSLRQTFICIPRLLSLLHPILFHQPLATVFEFVTVADAGRLMANVCEAEVPPGFWRHVYNIGGGERCRVTYVNYLDRVFQTLGLGSVARLTERPWFALKNFHCQWFLDSDDLEALVPFRRDGFDDYVAQVHAAAPLPLRLGLARLVPTGVIRNLVMKRLARRPEGPLRWVESDEQARVEAFFGSPQEWKQIPSWAEPLPPLTPAVVLAHGFDDTLADEQIGLAQARSAAQFRGGQCLSAAMEAGAMHVPLRWVCQAGHTFAATPYLVLRAGHWCRQCQPPPWPDHTLHGANMFLAQVH